jgi:pantoate--beta-alanine ligase
MIVASSAAALRVELAYRRAKRETIAFVPTMGNLHAGHLRLMHEARKHANVVVASIYVNPLQFGPSEDFECYPRTPEQDRAELERAGVDALFVPSDREMYPRGQDAQTRVEVPGLSDILCGVTRPGHFRGVTTAVNRLFNLVAPDVAVFGKKDYQQLLLIRLMVLDLGMPIEVVGVETVREPDGLAMSSRNQYLSAEERARAPMLYAALCALCDRLRAREAPIPALEKQAIEQLKAQGFRPEYVSVRRQENLGIAGSGDRELAILGAAWLGGTRLIDNVELVCA